MKDLSDAYGQEVYDYFRGRMAVEIVERDDGFISTGMGPAVYFADFEDWMPHQQESMQYVRGKVLDIGCGPGRHLLYLQEKGFDCLGIDSSPLAIEVCKQRGVKKAQVLSITQATSKLGTFDTILMMGNNFGLFGSYRRAKWLLKRFHKLTSAQGRIIAESNDVYQTEDPLHLAYHQRNRERGRMSGQLGLRVRHRNFKSAWFDYLLVSKAEMEDILSGTGWKVTRYLDSPSALYTAIIEKVGQ